MGVSYRLQLISGTCSYPLSPFTRFIADVLTSLQFAESHQAVKDDTLLTIPTLGFRDRWHYYHDRDPVLLNDPG